jgi:transcriptional regulator
MTAPNQAELLHGTLDTLILKTLAGGPMHGYAIGKWIEDATDSTIELEEGSLYPALYRMEEQGLIAAEWGPTENNRRAKFYQLTPEGRKQLVREETRWGQLVNAIGRVMRPAAAPGTEE